MASKAAIYNEARRNVLTDREKVCVNCGSREEIEMHHIVPLSMGGTNNEGNLVYLCRECHFKAHGAKLGTHSGDRGRKRAEKPSNADMLIEKYLTGDLCGEDARKMMGVKRQHTFKDMWFVKEYLEEHGISDVKSHRERNGLYSTEIWYKDGRKEIYFNGKKIAV